MAEPYIKKHYCTPIKSYEEGNLVCLHAFGCDFFDWEHPRGYPYIHRWTDGRGTIHTVIHRSECVE